MKIVHVSFANVRDYNDPLKFLDRIEYYTGILEIQSHAHSVVSTHCIHYSGTFTKRNVLFRFFELNFFSRFLPIIIYRFVALQKPDVIVVHGLHWGWYVLQLKLLLSAHVKIFAQHHAEKPMRSHKRYLQLLADRFIDGYFFSSFDLGEEWLRKGLIKDRRKIFEVMEVSSVFKIIDRQMAKERIKIEGSPVYLWVGRLDKNKDPETLIHAFERFCTKNKAAKLYIIFQSDELLGNIAPLLVNARDRVQLVGRVDHADLLYWYNASDFIISTSHYEGSGLAVCEAMSCGCVPIVTRIPSFRMMTDQGRCGLLFNAGEADSLQNALEKSLTLSLEEERKKVLRQFQENLSFYAIAKRIDEIIQRS